jgi:hypothetical protein
MAVGPRSVYIQSLGLAESNAPGEDRAPGSSGTFWKAQEGSGSGGERGERKTRRA